MTFALCFLTLFKELKQRQRLVQTNHKATTSSIHGGKIIIRTFYVLYFVKQLKITFLSYSNLLILKMVDCNQKCLERLEIISRKHEQNY